MTLTADKTAFLMFITHSYFLSELPVLWTVVPMSYGKSYLTLTSYHFLRWHWTWPSHLLDQVLASVTQTEACRWVLTRWGCSLRKLTLGTLSHHVKVWLLCKKSLMENEMPAVLLAPAEAPGMPVQKPSWTLEPQRAPGGEDPPGAAGPGLQNREAH